MSYYAGVLLQVSNLAIVHCFTSKKGYMLV